MVKINIARTKRRQKAHLGVKGLRYNLSTKNFLSKSTPWKVVYFGGKSWYLNEKSLSNEYLRYIIVYSLYIVILLFFRSLKYNLSTINC